MHEVDFLPVGDGESSGDAIALRFTNADTGQLAHVIIDAGYETNGDALVEHVQTYFGTNSIDLAILTHPDGDHIGGMGVVLRKLNVGVLAVHRLSDHGGEGLPAADAVDELIALAEKRGTTVVEPFAGASGFGGALRILGPSREWYEELVEAQQDEVAATVASGKRGGMLLEAARKLAQKVVDALPIEVPFEDAGGTNPRNNTSVITLVEVDGHRMLFTADAGVPALERAWDWLGLVGDPRAPDFVQIPHHGSKHNVSSDLLDRILGPKGQPLTKTAFVSVAPDAPKHPSARVVNAFMRRGYRCYPTAGNTLHHYSRDAPDRGWTAAAPLPPMDETGEED